ncbi:hypothetical protein AX16_000307 [Volvariella volvacea WC 439]|nr:hypothetical protein AX16_000307 [Volvariella volvacea WC 439]
MASREPLWYCHECGAEMRPLMVPDPVCASCRGSFVEKMENPMDDPREFAHPLDDGFGVGGPGPDMERMMLTIQALVNGGMADRRLSPRAQPSRSNTGSRTSESRATFVTPLGERRSNGTFTVSGSPPRMQEFLRRDPDGDGGNIAAPLMAQYLMSLLGHRHPLSEMLAAGRGNPGRMGDYVFNQEALDQIITQLMETSNANRPVPATEEVIEKLQRDVLELGSPLLEKDCAVCKEQFSVKTTDPEELVVVTLPCHHPFHQPCILPWLKSSGTCPVCRYALVPQPNHHPPGQDQDQHRPADGPSHSRSGSGSSGIFQSLFNLGSSSSSSGNSQPSSSQSRHNRSNSDPSHRSRASFPGSWSDQDLD